MQRQQVSSEIDEHIRPYSAILVSGKGRLIHRIKSILAHPIILRNHNPSKHFPRIAWMNLQKHLDQIPPRPVKPIIQDVQGDITHLALV